MGKITQQELMAILDYDPLVGVFRWKNGEIKGYRGGSNIADRKHSAGRYRVVYIDGESYLSHRLAWLYVHGYLPEKVIDHIDRDGSNNKISNLRNVSMACNLRNTGNYSHNKSGVKGVYLDKSRAKFCANIMVGGVNIGLGCFDDILEAACHRLAAEQAEDWTGCDSTSPAYKYVEKMVGQK